MQSAAVADTVVVVVPPAVSAPCVVGQPTVQQGVAERAEVGQFAAAWQTAEV